MNYLLDNLTGEILQRMRKKFFVQNVSVVMERDEKALWKKICKKDNDAYVFLVGETSKQLYNAAYKVLGDKSLAEDAVQDTYTQLLIHCKRIKVSLYSWLQTTVRNISINMSKKRKRSSDMEDKDIEFNINRVNCEEHKDSVTYLHVRDCLSKMPEDERNVFFGATTACPLPTFPKKRVSDTIKFGGCTKEQRQISKNILRSKRKNRAIQMSVLHNLFLRRQY